MYQRFNNTLACTSWLQYVNLQCPQKPLGPMTADVVKAVRVYELGIPHMTYRAEFPLLGKPGLKLGAEYPLQWLREQNIFGKHPAQDEGAFLQTYVQALDEVNPKLVDKHSALLEVDTSQESKQSSNIFVPLLGEWAETLLPTFLQAQHFDEYLPNIQKLLCRVRPFLEPWQLGFMHTRPKAPLRVTLVGSNDGVTNLMAGASSLVLSDFVNKAETVLYKISALQLFKHTYITVDILQDGSIGNIVSLELVPESFVSGEQKELLASEKFVKLCQILQAAGLADEGIAALPKCVFKNTMSGKGLGTCELHSCLAKLQLRWRGKKAFPARVALKMHTVPIRKSINDLFASPCGTII